MELTYEDAEIFLKKRIAEYPHIKALIEDRAFAETLWQIFELYGISSSDMPRVENSLMLVLTFYAPISNLPMSIAKRVGLDLQTATNLVSVIEELLLDPILNDLYAFDQLWKEQESKEARVRIIDTPKEPLELRAEKVTVPPPLSSDPLRPLTREEVLRAVQPKRTMATDIESVRQSSEANQKTQGYAQYYEEKKMRGE